MKYIYDANSTKQRCTFLLLDFLEVKTKATNNMATNTIINAS